MVLFSKKNNDDMPRRRRVEAAQRQRDEVSQEQSFAFRRNQTLTGSASSRVAALGESNAHIKSPRVHAHALARQRRHIGLMLLGVLSVLLLLFGLISQFTARAEVVATPDTSLQLDSGYEASVQSYLQSQPAERLRFALDETHLQEYVQAAYPEIKSIYVDGAAGIGASRFVVTLRTPVAGWTINGRQQYVDANGVAFTKNYFSSPAVQIIDKSGIQVAAGQAVASNRFLGFVGQIVGLAKQNHLKVTQVIIPSGTTRQIELKIEGVSYPVKLSVDRSAGEQVEDTARAIRWMKTHDKTPQYLDVRVSGRAYYR